MNTRLRSGLVSISFRKLTIEQIVALVAEAQLEGIEWGGDVHVPPGRFSEARRARALTEEAGLAVSAYGSYYRFDDCNSESHDEGPEVEAVLDTAEALGTQNIRVWVGRAGSAAASSDWWRTVVDRSKSMGTLAEKRGMKIGFEFHDNTLTDTNESTVRLLDEIDHPAVKTFWQTHLCVGHAYRLEGLKSLIGQVSSVHCNYFAEDGWPHMHALSEGEDEWMDYLQVLAGSGQQHWISIEHVKDNAIEQFREDAEVLKEWLSRF